MGPANITAMGALALLTFTHLRKTASNTFGEYTAATTEAIVKARIVVPVEMLVEFRNMIDSMIKQSPTPTASGGATRN
jgi:hypothetical protein